MKIEDKYVTNFYIIDRDTQAEIRAMQQSSAPARAKLMADILNDSEEKLLELALYHPDSIVPLEAQRWTWAVELIDILLHRNEQHNQVKKYTKRPDGGNWDFCGFEITTLPNMHSGHNGTGIDTNMLWAFSFDQFRLYEKGFRLPQSYHIAVLLADLVHEPRAVDHLTAAERKLIEKCPYVHLDSMNSGRIIHDIAIIDNATHEALETLLDTHPKTAELERLMNDAFADAARRIAVKNNPYLIDQLPRAVSFLHYHLRAMTMVGLGRPRLPHTARRAGEGPLHDLPSPQMNPRGEQALSPSLIFSRNRG